MSKELCIVHANCQGEPLAEFLGRVPGFGERHEVRLYTNYVHEPIADAELGRCAVFIYQPLLDESKWGELVSRRLLAKLPGNARSVAIPSMFFRHYWPFWEGGEDFSFRDRVLERLLQEGLSGAQALQVFLHTNVVNGPDMESLAAAALKHERIKESLTPIKYVDLILERFREEMLFNTVNHPGHALLCHVGREVLRHLGEPLPEDGVEPYMSELHPEFRMPIHPRVAAHWGLAFANDATLYPVYGRMKTFAQYAANYVDARSLGIDDLISYLRLR
ncbi:MAG: WcbI family polysaccharide biosynthesis putative acetyltransferase [Desulfovibrionaceae bacterium]